MKPIEIAAVMLGLGYDDAGDRLNWKLQLAIEQADKLVRTAGGVLQSRQAIAAIIVAWHLANPGEKAFD